MAVSLYQVGQTVRPVWSRLAFLGTGEILAVGNNGADTPRYAVAWTGIPRDRPTAIEMLETEIELSV